MTPAKPDGAPGVLHASAIAMAGPGMRPKLAREPFLPWRVPRAFRQSALE
jgi:hypothetical protein